MALLLQTSICLIYIKYHKNIMLSYNSKTVVTKKPKKMTLME